MPASPQTLLCAAAVEIAYAMRGDVLGDCREEIAGLGLAFEGEVNGLENGQPVEFGFVAQHPTFGRGMFLRGTDDDAEAIRDMEAIMVPCPLVPGGAWHAGFAALYLSLAVPAGPFEFVVGETVGEVDVLQAEMIERRSQRKGRMKHRSSSRPRA